MRFGVRFLGSIWSSIWFYLPVIIWLESFPASLSLSISCLHSTERRRSLIVKTCPGALYVALSRAKTMGTFTSDTSFPRDSAIYWHGSGISTFRILEGHKKTATTKVIQKSNVSSSPRGSAGLNIYTKKGNERPKGCLRHLPSEKSRRQNTLRSKYGNVLRI